MFDKCFYLLFFSISNVSFQNNWANVYLHMIWVEHLEDKCKLIYDVMFI